MPEPRWGWLIVLYLFLGGLSAGLFFVSSLALYLQRDGVTGYGRLARLGALLAPWPVVLGSTLLVFDLGHWYRFYKLFFAFEWRSPMSIGAWLLALFTAITVLSFWSWLEADTIAAFIRRLPRRLRFLRFVERPWRQSLRRPLGMLGFPLAVGVGIYTGVLLGAVQSRPFWNTNLVAQMFLFSALSTGCALLILLLSLRRVGLEPAEARLLFSLDIVLIVLELFVVLPYLIHGTLSPLAVQEALRLVLGGPFTVPFWVLFVFLGLLVPLVLEVWEMRPVFLARQVLRPGRGLAAASAGLVLFGGLVLRYVFVFAGQASYFQ